MSDNQSVFLFLGYICPDLFIPVHSNLGWVATQWPSYNGPLPPSHFESTDFSLLLLEHILQYFSKKEGKLFKTLISKWLSYTILYVLLYMYQIIGWNYFLISLKTFFFQLPASSISMNKFYMILCTDHL